MAQIPRKNDANDAPGYKLGDTEYNLVKNGQPPILSDKPFDKKMPMGCGCGAVCCWVCCPCYKCLECCMLPKVRGIPTTAQLLSPAETRGYLDQMQGHWFIQPLEAGADTMTTSTMMFTDVEVTGAHLLIRSCSLAACTPECGLPRAAGACTIQHNAVGVDNITRSLDGLLYVDYMGSVFEDFRPAEGYIIFNNALDIRIKFVRGWKRDGHPNPNPPAAADVLVAPGAMAAPPPPPLVVLDPEAVVLEAAPGAFCVHCGVQKAAGTKFCGACGKE